MDKSALLNAIANHANFKPMVVYALTENDKLNNADLFAYGFDYQNKLYEHFSLSPELVKLIAEKIDLEFDAFKQYFLKYFVNHSEQDLYQALEKLDYANDAKDFFASFFCEVRFFGCHFLKCLISVSLDHCDALSKYFAQFLDDTAEQEIDRPGLLDDPEWQEIKDMCLTRFRELIDINITCYDDLYKLKNVGSFVIAMNAYLTDKADKFNRDMHRCKFKEIFAWAYSDIEHELFLSEIVNMFLNK